MKARGGGQQVILGSPGMNEPASFTIERFDSVSKSRSAFDGCGVGIGTSPKGDMLPTHLRCLLLVVVVLSEGLETECFMSIRLSHCLSGAMGAAKQGIAGSSTAIPFCCRHENVFTHDRLGQSFRGAPLEGRSCLKRLKNVANTAGTKSESLWVNIWESLLVRP